MASFGGIGQSCPNCSNFQLVMEGLERCNQCGLGRSTTKIAASYEQNYLEMDVKEIEKRDQYFEYLFRTFVKNGKPKGVSLDVGCSMGRLVEVFRRHEWQAQGIDSYDGFSGDNTNYFQSTMDEFDQDGRYDFITLIHSFEHLKDPVSALGDVRRLLKPDGECLIVVPNFASSWVRLTGPDWPMFNLDHHYYHYTVDALERIMALAGFQVSRVASYSGYFTPSNWQIRLAKSGFFQHGWGSVQPFRSLIFRSIHGLRSLMNWWQDWRGLGAEIQILVRPL